MPLRSRHPVEEPVVVRRATLADTDLLVAHRLAMFREMGDHPARALARHAPAYVGWLVPRIASGELVAWVAEDTKQRPLGSGAVWFQPSQPRPGFDDVRVPYVLSVYTDPRARGRGIATTIVRRALALARRLGYARVTLHASSQGRGVYERIGFERTTELRYWLDPAQQRRTDRKRAAEAAAAKRAAVRAKGRSVRART
ncbi:MAG: GNAT family N-acetyltransferase [Thermoplasmata archaeon]|nr:GNAT family N-acetyltransferase [Thermoplasmata archaeon]